VITLLLTLFPISFFFFFCFFFSSSFFFFFFGSLIAPLCAYTNCFGGICAFLLIRLFARGVILRTGGRLHSVFWSFIALLCLLLRWDGRGVYVGVKICVAVHLLDVTYSTLACVSSVC